MIAAIKENTPKALRVLLPYQQRWLADESEVKLCEKSRRVGLSWCEAAEDALLAARSDGMDVFYIGYNKDMAREFIDDCAEWSRHYSKIASVVEEIVYEDEDKAITAFRIKFASGFKILALSSRPSNLRGKQGKVVIDEAAFHDDLGGLLKAAIALLMWGGRVVVISTHDGDTNLFNELIEDTRAGKKPYSIHRITLDDAIEEGLYERICLRRGIEYTEQGEHGWREELIDFYGSDADEELFCIPAQGTGSYLTRVMIESVMSPDIPIIRFEPPAKDFVDWKDDQRYREVQSWCEGELKPILNGLPEVRSWFGEDFGRNVDLTVIWPLQEMPGLKYHTPLLVELRDCPFSQQEQILFYIVDRLPHFCGGALDKGGNGAFLAERARQRYGVHYIEEISFNAGWYIENMPPYKACFEDKTITIPRDGDVLEDHRAIKKVKGVPKIPDSRTEGKDGGKRHGDSAIAGALALYAARTFSGGPIEYEATGTKRSFTRMDSYMGDR